MKKKNVILSSILSLAMCASLITGATYALFTSETETNVAITSGKVEVVSKVTDLKLYSHQNINVNTNVGEKIEMEGNTFLTGGTANYANGTLALDNIVPGDGVTFNVSVTNKSNVDIMYRTVISSATGTGLINALDVEIDETAYVGKAVSEWTALEANADIEDIAVSIELPTTAGNAYQNKTVALSIAVEAVQGNAIEVIDKWDGTVDELSDDYVIDTAAELAGFAEAVKAGDNFAGETVTLNANIDLAGNAWTPIGYGTINVPETGDARNEVAFAGTFDGQGYTISNVSINPGSDDDSASRKWGFFVGIAADGVVQNLTLKNVSVNNVTRTMTSIGSLAGRLDGKLENCHVKNVTIDSNTKMTRTGGLVGEAWLNAVINNCSVDGVNITCNITTDNGDLTAGVVGYINGDTSTCVKITNTTASNITLNGQYKTKRWAGFIGYANNSSIENCTLNNLEINVADYYQSVGGFIGDATNNTMIKNCNVNTAIINVARVSSGGTVGGFCAGTIASSANPVSFENCKVSDLYITAEGNVMGSGVVVGFIGGVVDGVSINNCSVEGVIEATAAPHPANGVVGTVAAFAKTTVNGENNTDNVTIK